jgi:hypothetical protein
VQDVIFLGAYVTIRVAVRGQSVTVQTSDALLRRAVKIDDRVVVAWSAASQTVLADE